MSDIEKTEQQWREQLGDEAYGICRQKGTERAFTGKYHDSKALGMCVCAAKSPCLMQRPNMIQAQAGLAFINLLRVGWLVSMWIILMAWFVRR